MNKKATKPAEQYFNSVRGILDRLDMAQVLSGELVAAALKADGLVHVFALATLRYRIDQSQPIKSREIPHPSGKRLFRICGCGFG